MGAVDISIHDVYGVVGWCLGAYSEVENTYVHRLHTCGLAHGLAYITPLAGHRDRSALGQGRDAAGDSALLSDTVLLTLYVDRGPVIEPSFRVTILQRGGGGLSFKMVSEHTARNHTSAARQAGPLERREIQSLGQGARVRSVGTRTIGL